MRKVQECFADGTASHLLAIAGAACAGGMKKKEKQQLASFICAVKLLLLLASATSLALSFFPSLSILCQGA